MVLNCRLHWNSLRGSVVLCEFQEMDSLAEQMANFNREMTTFATRTSRGVEKQVRVPEEVEFHEEGMEDEMRRNLQETQATCEKLLNGFMDASQSWFLKLEESIGRCKDLYFMIGLFHDIPHWG